MKKVIKLNENSLKKIISNVLSENKSTKKVIRLKESDIKNAIKNVLKEQEENKKLIVDSHVYASFTNGFMFSVKYEDDFENDSMIVSVNPTTHRIKVVDTGDLSDEEVKSGLLMVKESIKRHGLPNGISFDFLNKKDCDLQY